MQPYTLAPLPTKVENFIRRLERDTQARINTAFEYIVQSPFRHENPTTIRPLRGKKKGMYRYRIGDVRFIYQVDREERIISIVQIDNRGDIYYLSQIRDSDPTQITAYMTHPRKHSSYFTCLQSK